MYSTGTKVGLGCRAGEVKTIGTTMEATIICRLEPRFLILRAMEKRAVTTASRRSRQ